MLILARHELAPDEVRITDRVLVSGAKLFVGNFQGWVLERRGALWRRSYEDRRLRQLRRDDERGDSLLKDEIGVHTFRVRDLPVIPSFFEKHEGEIVLGDVLWLLFVRVHPVLLIRIRCRP